MMGPAGGSRASETKYVSSRRFLSHADLCTIFSDGGLLKLCNGRKKAKQLAYALILCEEPVIFGFPSSTILSSQESVAVLCKFYTRRETIGLKIRPHISQEGTSAVDTLIDYSDHVHMLCTMTLAG